MTKQGHPISNGAINKIVLNLMSKSKGIIDAHPDFQNAENGHHERGRVYQLVTCALRDEIPALIRSSPEFVDNLQAGHGAIRFHTGTVIDFENKKISVYACKGLFRIIARYLGRWLVLLLALLKGFVAGAKQSHNNYCLVYGLYETHHLRQGGISPFERYVQGSPIDPIKYSEATISQISANARTALMPPSSVARFPEADYLTAINISWSDRMTLLLAHGFGLFRVFFNVLKRPIILIFLEDMATVPLYLRLKEMGLSPSVVISTSDTRNQSLWMRQLPEGRLHYLHYAITPLYVIHQSDAFQDSASIEVESFAMSPMKHWVWFESDAAKLKEIYHQNNVVVSGVPSFILPSASEISTNQKFDLDIVIFDVTPLTEQYAFIGQNFYYGQFPTAKSIVQDAVDIANEIKDQFGITARIRLKPKRGRMYMHDMRYHDFLEELEQSDPIFSQVLPETNLNDLVQPQSLVIARPYTSLGFVMPAIGISTIFYDPSNEIMDNCPQIDKLQFSQGRDQLKASMMNFVRDFLLSS